MTTYTLDDTELAQLKDKTVLVIGAATGIGRETVKLAHNHGANVAFGDWNETDGRALAAELKDRVLFQPTDASSWSSVLALFRAAHAAFPNQPPSAVLCVAGINREDFLADAFDPVTGDLLPPDLKVLDVNLAGAVYAVKLAVHFFERNWVGNEQEEGGERKRCQIVLTGSAASFLDTPPLNLYCASKAGVLGLMRALRTQLVGRGITVNMVAPWMTKSAMTRELEGPWIDEWKLPANEPEDVARALLLPVVRPDVNGKSLFVAGARIIEFEDALHECQPDWMGERLSREVDEGQRRLLSATQTTFTANC